MSAERVIANTLWLAQADLEAAKHVGKNRYAIYHCEQAAEKVDRGLRGRVGYDFAQTVERPAVREDNTEDRAVGRDRELVDDRVNGVAQIFKTRDQCDIECSGRDLPAEARGMIELHHTIPAMDKRERVEILDATETKRRRRRHLRRRPGRGRFRTQASIWQAGHGCNSCRVAPARDPLRE